MANPKDEWKWIGGRLYHPTYPKLNYSVTEAYELIPVNKGIAKACKDVLQPYDKRRCEIDARTINEILEERQA